MDKNTKITLAGLIKRKEQVLEAKKSPKKARIYVKSLDGEIIIKAPTKSLATEAAERMCCRAGFTFKGTSRRIRLYISRRNC